MSLPETVRANPAVRLERSGGWRLTILGRRTAHRVGAEAAAVLFLGAQPITVDRLTSQADELGIDADRCRPLVAKLLEHGFLLDADGANSRDVAGELQQWARADWRAASVYHYQTYGYEFETYDDRGTSAVDRTRMTGYGRLEADTDRVKHYPASDLTSTSPVPGPADLVLDGLGPAALDAPHLMALVSMVGGIVRTATLPWPGAADALRRTSPSGGSRHPTEIYLEVAGIAGLEDGWHHFRSVPGQLDRLSISPSVVPSGEHGSTAARSPSATIVYTTMFRRNRYRYREPRTFRTVHLDVGHLLGTCGAAAEALGLRARHTVAIDEQQIARELGLDLFAECPIAISEVLLPNHGSSPA